MSTEYPRESVEWQPINITVDGTPVLTGVQVAVVPAGVRPAAWTTPTTLAGKLGVMLTGLTLGLYDIWVQVNGYAPETPVVFAGSVRIT